LNETSACAIGATVDLFRVVQESSAIRPFFVQFAGAVGR
jgi:hypothetical protein